VATRSIDGKFVCNKLLGEFGEPADSSGTVEGFQRGIFIRPARSLVGFHADYGYTLNIRPLSVSRTEVVSNWLVHEDAEEGVDYDLDTLCELLDVTYTQDVALTELAQKGTRSRRYVPGPLHKEQEPFLRDTLMAYLNLMDGTVD
jgi:Rieske 2Fe-2S family protein